MNLPACLWFALASHSADVHLLVMYQPVPLHKYATSTLPSLYWNNFANNPFSELQKIWSYEPLMHNGSVTLPPLTCLGLSFRLCSSLLVMCPSVPLLLKQLPVTPFWTSIQMELWTSLMHNGSVTRPPLTCLGLSFRLCSSLLVMCKGPQKLQHSVQCALTEQ